MYMTRYRKSILEIINTTEEHMTTEEIFFLLKERFPSVVMATVYNNLNYLYEQGYIRKISLEGQPERYDRNTRHDHLLCRCCGKLADITLSDLSAELEEQVGFHIDGYDLKIQYLCPECRKNSERTAEK